MSSFKDSTFLSENGKTNIHVRSCIPDALPVGVVQIAHGIAEYAARYDGFARFLADHGWVVVANDHLGHGQSIREEADLGFFAENGGWELAVGDMRKLYEQTHAAYPELPYFLFGHSMGSFLTRTYLIRCPAGLRGAVICGTGQQGPALVAGGNAMASAVIRRKGPRCRSELLNKLAFGSYNKCFPDKRTDYDWLSRDPEVVDRYIADPLCGFLPTAGLFGDMMGGIRYISAAKNIARMPKDLPVFFISGDMDPVGENGKGVTRAYNAFLAAGMQDVTVKLYHDCRHELLNELNRDEVMRDVLGWLELHRGAKPDGKEAEHGND